MISINTLLAVSLIIFHLELNLEILLLLVNLFNCDLSALLNSCSVDGSCAG